MVMERGTTQGKGKDSMLNDRRMIVMVVQRDTAKGKLVLRRNPTWSGILGEKVEIRLSTATRSDGYVRFNGMVLTGTRSGAELTISTAIMALTPDQYRQIDGLIGGETTAATA